VAGPVGEALIMTAIGLFVAIPAVLAYNACTRSNRLMLAALERFAHGLHAYLVAGVRQLPPQAMPGGALQPQSAGKGLEQWHSTAFHPQASMASPWPKSTPPRWWM
jgi:biopolymer transport protein ExbB